MGERGRPPRGRDERQPTELCRSARPLPPGPRCPWSACNSGAQRQRACRACRASATVITPHIGRDHASFHCCRTSTRKETAVSSPDLSELPPSLTDGGPAIQRLLFVADAAVADVGQLPAPVRA